MDQNQKFLNWLCGGDEYPFFQENPPFIPRVEGYDKTKNKAVKCSDCGYWNKATATKCARHEYEGDRYNQLER